MPRIIRASGNKKVIGILCADIHLRDDIPVARTDDYWKAQEKKFNFILQLSGEHACPIFVAGDFFDKAKSSQYLEQWVICQIKKMSYNDIYVIPGQHDLPNHNLTLYEKSSLRVLEAAGLIKFLHQEYDESDYTGLIELPGGRIIRMVHTMVYEMRPIHDSIEGTKASRMLKRYKQCDVVLTGDNHLTFTCTDEKGRSLVNPGSMMRMDADQQNHKPSVFLWYNDNRIEQVFLPLLVKKAVSREHLEKKEFRNVQLQTLIKRIKNDYEVGVSFEKNLKALFRKNKDRIKKSVQELVWRFVDGEE